MDVERGLRLIGELERQLTELQDLRATVHTIQAALASILPVDACSFTVTTPTEQHALVYLDGVEQTGEGASALLEAPRDAPALAALQRRHRSASAGVAVLPASQIVRVARQQDGAVEVELAIAARQHAAYDAVDGLIVAQVAETLAAWTMRRSTRAVPLSPSAAASARHAPHESDSLAAIAAALATISANIAEEYPPEQVYMLILRQAASLLPIDDAVIQVWENGMVQTGAMLDGRFAAFYEHFGRHPVWRDYRPLDTSLRDEEPTLGRLFDDVRLGALLSLPFLSNGVIAGRLTIATRARTPFDTYQVHISLLLAERAAQALRASHLRESLDQARAKSAQLDLARRDFVATVSHQLRTPLTGILGYIELLLDRWDEIDEQHRYSLLQRAQSAAVRLEHLITDLLLFSNVEHQELKLALASYPLQMLIEQAVESMRTKYRGQVIHLRPARTPAYVRVDARRAVQVITNLLDNAIKYSEAGTPVEIQWTTHRHEVEVHVRDFGPGIKEEDMPRLFTRFGTLGHHPRPGQVGTGIGLYISRKLLDAMHGRIWATSKPGHGSVFHFTLPLDRPGSG